MNLDLLLENLTNPALLFFLLGLLGVQLKSDLEIPGTSSRFISLYLLFSIGFKGGQELSHHEIDREVVLTMVYGIVAALIIPVYAFFLLKKKVGVQNAGAIAAAYGSVSAVTFVTSVSFLEIQNLSFGGHMVAVMAMMEAPAIVIGVFLISMFDKGPDRDNVRIEPLKIIKHALTNGSVYLILGSLIIGYIANEEQAKGIAPFTTDIFKGFLAIFLLDMGINCGRRIKGLTEYGSFAILFAILVPLFNGLITAWLSGYFIQDPGNRFLLSILAASASYIAVPAAMRISAPESNPGLYVPMALAITFPVNISLGMPLYMMLIQQ